MADMAAHHEKSIVADTSVKTAPSRTGVHCYVLADHVSGSDFQIGFYTGKFKVLRLVTDRGKRPDSRARTNRRVTCNRNMTDQFDAVVERNLRTDHTERTNLDIQANLSAVFYYGGRVDRHEAAPLRRSSS